MSGRVRLALTLVAVAVLTGCGSSHDNGQPPGPWDWRPVNDNLWMACTPPGDRVYAYEGASGSGVAVVPAGCLTEPRA